MKFKKIYIEITNICNLNCDFCIHKTRKNNIMSIENYKYIIDKIKNYTKEIYLHVLGEPLTHKNIFEIIDYANQNNLLVNITTNGYLIQNIKNNTHIHRLNISLHSYDNKYNIPIENYLDNIYLTVESLRQNTYITLRLWTNNLYTKDIIKYINQKYNTNIENIEHYSKIKIAKNLIIDTFHPFIWPDLNNNYYNSEGTCKGLIDHIGILSDGTIIPCCLDSKGTIKLGNIYNDDLTTILNRKKAKDMLQGFKEGKKIQELCKHCNFQIKQNKYEDKSK